MVATPLSTIGQTVEALIARHGALTSFTRSTRTRSGGGFVTTTSTHGPHRVLVTERRAAPVRIVLADPGTTRRDQSWVLLGGSDVVGKLLATADVIDRFTLAPLGTFRVREIRPLLPYWESAGVVADLEREG